ncbi:TonB-dependent receptor [Granulicella sp. dw_53]|uniref:TonB-dependent receptor n=1 Tax=Granulicella sp. dw_53 TaxID=2719792 RepID=UPI001BD59915
MSFAVGLLLVTSIPAVQAQDQQALAQSSYVSEIHGVLQDGSGASIAEGNLVLTDSTGKSLETNSHSDGTFVFRGLVPGTPYRLLVMALGMNKLTREGVLAGGPLLVLPMQVDPLQQSITVFATSPELDTAPELSRTLDPTALTQLPSTNRNLAQFAMLDPRARNTVGSGSDGRSSTRLTINNQSFRFTQYELDGSTDSDFILSNGPQQNVSISAIGEFKLLTNEYLAQYGRSSGGVVLLSTKSGTDQFHGEAFGYVRPSGIQAAPPVSTFHVPNAKEQWGSTIGGPLQRGKTYFLGSYEQQHQERGAFIQSPTPGFFTGIQNSYMGLLRLDRKWNDREFTTVRLNGDFLKSNNLNDVVGGFVQANAGRNDIQQSTAGQITQRSMLGTWLNDFRLSYSNALPLWYTPFTPSIQIVRPSYSTTGGSSVEHLRSQAWQAAETISKTFGAHAFTFGGDYIHQYTNYNFISTPLGTYTFAAGPPTPNQMPLRYTQTVGAQTLKYGQDLVSAFAQDEWKATRRLSTNLGVRYDYQSNSSGVANFQPRLGVAWDAFGNGNTVVRAGAGLFYDQIYGQLQRNALNLGPNSSAASYTISNPSYPTPPTVGGAADRRDIMLLNPRLKNPYTMEVSAGVEQKLPMGWVLQLDAVFMGSRHQLMLDNLNAPTPFIRTAPGQTRAAVAANATRPSLFYTRSDGTQIAVANVEQVDNVGNSRNTSGEAQISRRFGGLFQFQAAYLYSSNITNVFFTGGNSTGTPSVWNVKTGESGPSDFFQRHRFVATGILNLPAEFRLTGVTVAATGLPVNPLTGVDNDGDGILADRAFGVSRNSYRGPAQAQTDLAVTRTFHVWERLSLESRAEISNIFNHGNYVKLTTTYGNGASPGNSFMIPTAGISNSDPARQFQFGARLLF